MNNEAILTRVSDGKTRYKRGVDLQDGTYNGVQVQTFSRGSQTSARTFDWM